MCLRLIWLEAHRPSSSSRASTSGSPDAGVSCLESASANPVQLLGVRSPTEAPGQWAGWGTERTEALAGRGRGHKGWPQVALTLQQCPRSSVDTESGPHRRGPGGGRPRPLPQRVFSELRPETCLAPVKNHEQIARGETSQEHRF